MEEPVKSKEPKKFFGLSMGQILGLLAIIIGFIVVIIGICMLALCLFGSKSVADQRIPVEQLPPKQKKKSKPKEDKPPAPIKKESTIEQEAAQLLVEEYQNTSIPLNIVVPSDTEGEQEQEVQDPED